ncbi:hypothetical protein BH10PSE17_BH10PSE17_28780 [soil metagenome]
MSGLRPFLAVCLAASLSACFTPPKAYQSMREAYPDPQQITTTEVAPAEAAKSATYEASFEDVFRLAAPAAKQVQWRVDDAQQSAGLLYASNDARVKIDKDDDNPSASHFYYGIHIKRIAPKITQVRVVAKVQSQCVKWPTGLAVPYAVLSLGMTIPIMMSANSQCDQASKPDWALDTRTAEPYMAQFLTALRNGLFAAGAM